MLPKADPTAPPHWVCNFLGLNVNTVKDRTPLLRINEILNDCAKGQYFAKIDMTNAFFQTQMHPDDVPLMAISTLFGLFEWVVMPIGLCNAPSTHQRHMYRALQLFIGKICHVYLDDIIIWSDTLEEHSRNTAQVMDALRESELYCSQKKTHFYLTEAAFLGHVVVHESIRPDPSKVTAIKSWPTPTRTRDVRVFLGLIRYIATFLPHLAEHTCVLMPLTKKELDKEPLPWSEAHQLAFEVIKDVASVESSLATIQTDSPGNIYVTTDASNVGTSTLLSLGDTWESAQPVAYNSMQLNVAQRNYPTHEKELLAIVRALEKWCYYLLGT